MRLHWKKIGLPCFIHIYKFILPVRLLTVRMVCNGRKYCGCRRWTLGRDYHSDDKNMTFYFVTFLHSAKHFKPASCDSHNVWNDFIWSIERSFKHLFHLCNNIFKNNTHNKYLCPSRKSNPRPLCYVKARDSLLQN